MDLENTQRVGIKAAHEDAGEDAGEGAGVLIKYFGNLNKNR